MPSRAISTLTVPATLRIEGRLDSPPRMARFRTKIRVALLAAVVACAVVATVVAVAASFEADRLARLRDHGVVTDAVVEKKWKSGGKSKTRYVRYAFTCAGRRFTDDSSLSSQRWDRVEPGQPIRITYDPDDPGDTEVGAVTQATIDAHWTQTALGGGVAGTIVLGLLAVWYLRLHRHRALLAEGDLTSARIESIGKPSGKRRRCRVVFAVAASGHAVAPQRHTIEQKLLGDLAAGESVPYLVLRHAPEKGAPLGLCLQSSQLE